MITFTDPNVNTNPRLKNVWKALLYEMILTQEEIV